jgi:MoaA/NifB/PqqE/SkfB family radical SAM enzyme
MKPLHYPLRVLQNQRGWVPRPSFCTYLVCNRCNARCGMCDSWRIPRGVELDADQVYAVFRKLGSLDAVRLSGGEPFLRADLLPLAEAVVEASTPALLHITTNGSFPERLLGFVRSFSRPRRLHVMVSFDGMHEVHDQSRGRRVSFERALASVDALVAERSRGIQVSVNHTIISRAALRDHAELSALMAERGVDTQWVLAYAESSMYALGRRGQRAPELIPMRGYPLHPDLDRGECLAFAEAELCALGRIRSRSLRLAKRYYLQGLLARLQGEQPARPKPKCVALRSHVRLLPDGAVVVCQFNTEPIGNLTLQSFEDLWHAAAARRAREWVDACSGCWAECEVMPNAIYSGDLLAHALDELVRGAWRGATAAG